MRAVDTNVLVHAHRLKSPLHEPSRLAVARLAEGPANWAIPWSCIHEFYSLVTNPRVFPEPTPPSAAWEQIEAWMESPTLVLLSEARSHAEHLRDLVIKGRVVGARVHDARIAAVCLSHGVQELISFDRDFTRFPGLTTRSPLG